MKLSANEQGRLPSNHGPPFPLQKGKKKKRKKKKRKASEKKQENAKKKREKEMKLGTRDVDRGSNVKIMKPNEIYF